MFSRVTDFMKHHVKMQERNIHLGFSNMLLYTKQVVLLPKHFKNKKENNPPPTETA